ncbi:MAG: hypothetical protein RLY86_3366 [Pseudomonadota bacterium]|jgi:ABC-type transport system involved in multi-copper enzyme maturation permease subunit
MLMRIARFELAYQLRQPPFWVCFAVFFLISFLSIASDNVQIGAQGGTHANAPYAVTLTLLFMSLIGMFIPMAIMPGTVLRDADTGMAGILYSLPVTKTQLLLGRFIAAYAVVAIAFLGAPLGHLTGSFMWWLDPEELGPTRLDVYLQVLTVFALPNLLILGCLFFAVAAITRTQWAVYVALIAFLILYVTAGQLIDDPGNSTLEGMVDPFGIQAALQGTRYWTVFERNSQAVPLEGIVLYNRVAWLGGALALVAVAVVRFRFETQPRRGGGKAAAAEPVPAPVARPHITPAPAGSAGLAQLWRQSVEEALGVLRGPGFLVLLALGVFNTGAGLINLNSIYGTPIYPVTRVIVEAIAGNFSLIAAIVVIYYAGELVWRDRQARVAEIVTACPVPGWVFALSKLLALALVLLTLFTVAIVVGLLAQLLRGFTDIDPGLYLGHVFGLTLTDFLMLGVLALFIQVLAPNKMIGMLILVGYILLTMVATRLGLVDNLILFGGEPGVPLSDMNGMGHFVTPVLWFNLYWGLFCVLLVVLSHRLWPGAVPAPLTVRLAALRGGWGGGSGAIAAAALAGFVLTGGWIGYNTHGLNDVRTEEDGERDQVEFEKRFRQYETLPQPEIVAVRTDIDLYPTIRRYAVRGSYVLENRTDAPVPEIHVAYASEVDVTRNEIAGIGPTRSDTDFNYFIFTLAEPLAPGAQVTLDFAVEQVTEGFTNHTDMSAIRHNGTFINNLGATPFIGFPEQALISDESTRRKYDLPPLPRMADLDDKSRHTVNYLRDDSDWVTFETTVSTDPDQIAVAPGYLQREWEENGRRYFHYKMDAPILNFYSWLSARYTVARETWNGIDLAVYYHGPHGYNVPRMMEAMRKSLDYFTAAFGPYQHRQMRILEFPAYANFAQSFPNTVPYSESIGFIADIRDPGDIDYVFYITAHEVAHQWWAHQVMGADVQGSTMLSEAFSQYSALMVLEREYGPDKMRRFLKYELDQYLRGRGGEDREERPLYRVENQQYIHYQKGSLAMYALKDYVGEEVVNRALARLVRETAYRHDPYPTSRDFLRILREEAGPEHETLIQDLFEKIVLWDLEVADHTVEKMEDGRWKVILTLATSKLEADGKGQETRVPLDQRIDIGLFARDPADEEFTAADVILLEKHRISGDAPVIELIVDREPRALGIDPYNKLIDRDSDDNIVRR